MCTANSTDICVLVVYLNIAVSSRVMALIKHTTNPMYICNHNLCFDNTTAVLKITSFWNISPYSLVNTFGLLRYETGMFLTLRRKMSPSSFTWQILGLPKVESLKMKGINSFKKSVLEPRSSFESLMISVRDHRQLLNDRLDGHLSDSWLLEKKGNTFIVGSQTPDFRVHSLVTITAMLSHVFILDIFFTF
jgi:hypothetical protein